MKRPRYRPGRADGTDGAPPGGGLPEIIVDRPRALTPSGGLVSAAALGQLVFGIFVAVGTPAALGYQHAHQAPSHSWRSSASQASPRASDLASEIALGLAVTAFGLFLIKEAAGDLQALWESEDEVTGTVEDRHERRMRGPTSELVLWIANEAFTLRDSISEERLPVGAEVELLVGHRSRSVRRLVVRGHNAAPPPLPARALEEGFGFTADELAANRMGQVTPSQRGKLEARVGRLRWRAALVALGSAVAFLVTLSRGSQAWAFVTAGGAWLIFVLIDLARVRADIEAGTVGHAAGVIHLGYSRQRTQVPGGYWLSVDGETFETSMKEYRGAHVALGQVVKPPRARIYFAVASGEVLSLELVGPQAAAASPPARG